MKLISLILILSLPILLTNECFLLSQPKREVRAVWLTTNFQLDWPPSHTYNPEIQKQKLIEILDNLKSKNFNTIYFQVRSQGSVMYKSNLEPWSPYLTGTLGKAPSYDPLEFLIKEARKKFFEVHAWINVFPVKSGDAKIPISDPPHIMLARPEWIRIHRENNQNVYWLDPGLPEVRDYIKNICIELTKNYDIDGIHLDYIRYPGKSFNDTLTFRMYGGGRTLDDFRRESINQLITEIYDTVTFIKPHVKVGSAPIGIYENISDAKGLEGKNALFQDSREWLRSKKHDYMVPQIYWDIQNNPKFESLVHDWTKNNYGRHIIAGIGAYNDDVFKELEEQINITRKYNAAGQSFFRYENIKDTKFNSYKYLANIPPMNWKDSIPPKAPYLLSGKNLKGKLGLVELVWGIPEQAEDGDTAKYYNIYKGLTKNINRNSPRYLYTFSNTYYFYDFISKPVQTEFYYQVTSLDKLHNESIEATEIIKVKLENLIEALSDAFPVIKVAISFNKNLLTCFIELTHADKGKIELCDDQGVLIKKIYEGKFSPGLNSIQFEIPQLRKKKFELKIYFSDRIEKIDFELN